MEVNGSVEENEICWSNVLQFDLEVRSTSIEYCRFYWLVLLCCSTTNAQLWVNCLNLTWLTIPRRRELCLCFSTEMRMTQRGGSRLVNCFHHRFVRSGSLLSCYGCKQYGQYILFTYNLKSNLILLKSWKRIFRCAVPTTSSCTSASRRYRRSTPGREAVRRRRRKRRNVIIRHDDHFKKMVDRLSCHFLLLRCIFRQDIYITFL